jgi:predicted ester cyclase
LLLDFGFQSLLKGVPMSEENKALMRRFYAELFGKKNLGAIDEYLADSFLDNDPNPGQKPGVDGVKETLGGYLQAFPDMQVDVDFQVAEGDKVVSRLIISGTQTGDMPGVPATGKAVRFTVMDVGRVVNGKIVERWGNDDTLGMMQQLGVIPTG